MGVAELVVAPVGLATNDIGSRTSTTNDAKQAALAETVALTPPEGSNEPE